jgi:hypothetical protein
MVHTQPDLKLQLSESPEASYIKEVNKARAKQEKRFYIATEWHHQNKSGWASIL